MHETTNNTHRLNDDDRMMIVASAYKSELEEEIRSLFSLFLKSDRLSEEEWTRLHVRMQNRLRDQLNLLKRRREAIGHDPTGVICLL